ncbi:MAG: CARDB domain-containing protein, partial [Myxococcales bacterium]
IDPASDNKVGAHGSPLTLAAKGTAVVNTTVSVARPQTGSKLFMGIELDPIGAVQDAHRSNNRSASAPFVVGVDLYAVSVTGPATAGLGAAVTLNATVGNAGSDPVTATFGIYMSADRVIDPATDIKVGETQITLGGFERKTVSIAGQVPRNFATTSNELHWGVYADPGKQQQEPSRADNGASSVAKVTIVLPDLTAENLRLNRTEDYFGERASFTAELQNIGEGDALNATVWLVLSDNASITLTDHAIALVDNLNIPRKGKVTVQFDDVYLPLYPDGGSVPYATGKYFFGVILDPMRQIPEQSETNNGIAFQPEVTVRQPAPDFHAVRVDGPPVSAGGELVPVSRLIRNIGNRGNDVAGKAYRYQYFLSENEIISVQDRLLPLVVDGVEKTFGTGRLAAGAEDRGVDQVRLPKNLPAGDYFLGMVVDPTNEIDELREDNNIVASGALVRVVGTGLDIVNQWLPDATERVGYLRQLVARGGTGSYQWRVVPGYGQLPQGMSLSADGILSGTPTRAGVADFVVEVTSGNLSSMARLLLRVFTPTGTLQLVTRTLPLGVEGRPYGFDGSTGASGVTLVGSGGVPPYKWALVGTSTLPTGVSFNNGVLAGTP